MKCEAADAFQVIDNFNFLEYAGELRIKRPCSAAYCVPLFLIAILSAILSACVVVVAA
jgi:hypothetical protein